MAKKSYWINFVLILIVVYLSVKNYEEYTSPRPRGKETSDTKQKAAATPASASSPQKGETPPPAYYKVISEKNLFSVERKEFPPPLPPPEAAAKEKPAPPPKPPARPNMTLYGVAIVGEDSRTALVNNPYRKPEKGDRETMTVREGDKVGEYSVGKIAEDRITLESSGDSFDVLLFDPARQKKRAAAAPPPPASGISAPAPDKPGQPSRVTPTPPRPFTPPAAPPAVSPAAPRDAPIRDLLRERLEQRRLQRMPQTQGQPQPRVQPQPRSPAQREEDEEEED